MMDTIKSQRDEMNKLKVQNDRANQTIISQREYR